ncbi:MAG: aryl-sulfate sulfotransferase [Lachnospiraceae bacterium]|nr:aryl-sulfate sulfotransferase [Lachnospiraceae bacterium]
MGLFKKNVEIKNPTKVTYSEEDLKKVDVAFYREFSVSKGEQIHSPIKKEIPFALLSQIRDRGFEDILDKQLYTFKHLLVIPNPYGASKQTALLLFNTSKPCKVRYTVHGKKGEDVAFSGETEFSKRHRVPIFGLYVATTNKITLELINEAGEVDKRRPLTIYVSDPPLEVLNQCKKPSNPDTSNMPLTMFSGFGFSPVVYDKNMDIRYTMDIKISRNGIVMLDNGHFLFGQGEFTRVSEDGRFYQCMYHECDFLGRIYKSYIIDYPMGDNMVCDKERVYFVTKSEKTGLNSDIATLNLLTGKVENKKSMEDIFGKDFVNDKEATVTGVEEVEDSIILTYKKIDTIICLNKSDFSVKWVIGENPYVDNSDISNKKLKYIGLISDEEIADSNILKNYAPSDRDFPKDVFDKDIGPYYTEILESLGDKMVISCFNSNGMAKEGDKRKYRIGIFLIDLENMKIGLVNAIADFGFNRYAKTMYLEDKGSVIASKGVVMVPTNDDIKARINEYSMDGTPLNEVKFFKSFAKLTPFNPDVKELSVGVSPSKDVIFGTAKGPVETDEKLAEPVDKKLLKKLFNNMRLTSGILLISIRKNVKALYFVGKKTFKQDFTILDKTNMLDTKKRNFAIYVDDLPKDEYDLYVDVDGEIYKLKDELRVED